MVRAQQGFTLIELVMVIVILGILAATAIPRFVDLSTDAEIAAAEGVAGSIASASAINYATRATRGSGGAGVIDTTSAGAGTGGCADDTVTLLLNDGLPDGYGVDYDTGTYASATDFGDTWTCKITDGTNDITDTSNNTITFSLHYVD